MLKLPGVTWNLHAPMLRLDGQQPKINPPCLYSQSADADSDLHHHWHNLSVYSSLKIDARVFHKRDLGDIFTEQHLRWKITQWETLKPLAARFSEYHYFLLRKFVSLPDTFSRQKISRTSGFILTSSLKWLKSAKFGCCTLFWGVFSETLVKWGTWQKTYVVLINQIFPPLLIYETFIFTVQRQPVLCSLHRRAHQHWLLLWQSVIKQDLPVRSMV